MKTVNVNQFADALMEDLNNITDSMCENVKKAVDEVALETKNEIDRHITFNDYGNKKRKAGTYRKSLKLKTVSETKTGKTVVWYASGKEYRLTHLLEYGHKTRLGSGNSHVSRDGTSRKAFTNAYPHIRYGYEYANANLPKRIEEALNNAN